jgi:peptidoglycan hydrolase CwlO-like protein
MDSLSNIILSGLMGLIGASISIPLNAFFSWYLKREELDYQLKINTILELRKKSISQLERREKDVINIQKDVETLKKIVQEIWKKIS